MTTDLNVLNQAWSNLQEVNTEIEKLCRANNVPVEDLSEHADAFSYSDQDRMIALLRSKLTLQKKIFELQGGDLSNVVQLPKGKKKKG